MTRIVRMSLVTRFPTLLVSAWLVAGTLLVPAIATHAALTPEKICQNGRYAAAAKYSACEQRATGKFIAGNHQDFSRRDETKFEDAVSKCRVKYTGTWARLQAKARGTGATCDQARFDTTSTPGTVIDQLTGLQWEQKTDDATVHDKDNQYSWSVSFTAADGSAFTTFLAALNGGCFAGHCDWRLPTRSELQTILLGAFPCNTCIDQAVFGPTAADGYWSATTSYVIDPGFAWNVYLSSGFVGGSFKYDQSYVRAVRGGL